MKLERIEILLAMVVKAKDKVGKDKAGKDKAGKDKAGEDKRNKQRRVRHFFFFGALNFAKTADIRRVLHTSRKREGEALEALHNVVNARVTVKRDKRESTLGDTPAAKALRAQMIEVVREHASRGEKAAIDAAVAAGFIEKEVASYVRFAPVTDKIVFGEGEEVSEKKDEDSDSSS